MDALLLLATFVLGIVVLVFMQERNKWKRIAATLRELDYFKGRLVSLLVFAINQRNNDWWYIKNLGETFYIRIVLPVGMQKDMVFIDMLSTAKPPHGFTIDMSVMEDLVRELYGTGDTE